MKKTDGGRDPGRTFRVQVTETYQRTIAVHETELKAPTQEEALRTVEEWWKDSQIELTQEDFRGVEFREAKKEGDEG